MTCPVLQPCSLWSGGALVAALVLAYAGYRQSRTVIHAYQESSRIPYVLPVVPSDLPTRAILVRSAEEPSALSETLLRAAKQGEETKAEELLRAGIGTEGSKEGS